MRNHVFPESLKSYKKPPKAFQFQKGRSGNPSGRPRKVLGIAELLAKILRRRIVINGKNGSEYMTMREATLTQLVHKGAKGDLKAVQLLMQMVTQFPEPGKQEDNDGKATSAIDKLLAALEG